MDLSCPSRPAGPAAIVVHALSAVTLLLATASAVTLLLAAAAAPSIAGPTFGFFEDFSDGTTAGFISGAMISNPGTGGVGGDGDGFLRIARPDSFPGFVGAFNLSPDYIGNYLAAGVTRIIFQLNDIEGDQAFEIHLAIGNGVNFNFWQYNTGFSPPEQSWEGFKVDLTDSLNFTQIIGTANYTLALTSVDRVLWRHDLAPYVFMPDAIAGQVGLDRIVLTGDAAGIAEWAAPGAIRLELLGARPNPARPGTTIGANLGESGQIRLTIVSAAGRIVRELYAGALGAGAHAFPWDGRDSRGAEVSAGVYFIELKAGERLEVGRLAVIR